MSDKFFRPTWAEIKLPSIEKNILRIRKIIGTKTKYLFVIKGNAYGHGAVEIAKYVEKRNLCWGFGVSSVEEGLVLRDSKLKSPVLILGSLYPFNSFIEAIKKDLMVTIASIDAARQVIEASKKLSKKPVCHIKLETGMGRIGARKPGVVRIFEELLFSRSVKIAGIYTHLSSADTDAEFTKLQLRYFKETLTELEKYGLNGGLDKSGAPADSRINSAPWSRQLQSLYRHVANSYAAIHYPQSRYDMVRIGLASYGLFEDFEPALSLKTRVVFLKNIRSGSSVGYNRSFKAARPMKIATLPIGYGDGYLRAFSNKSHVLINGVRAKVLGSITMDMTTVDVTAMKDVSVGDEVVVIGRQNEKEIKVTELSHIASTVPYEIVTIISTRVPRIYIK
jgi:alanine racemase